MKNSLRALIIGYFIGFRSFQANAINRGFLAVIRSLLIRNKTTVSNRSYNCCFRLRSYSARFSGQDSKEYASLICFIISSAPICCRRFRALDKLNAQPRRSDGTLPQSLRLRHTYLSLVWMVFPREASICMLYLIVVCIIIDFEDVVMAQIFSVS